MVLSKSIKGHTTSKTLTVRSYALMQTLSLILLLLCTFSKGDEDLTFTASSLDAENELALFQIEGKVTPPEPNPLDWYCATRILIDGGRKLAFIKVT